MKTYRIFGLVALMILTFASCETEVVDPAGTRDEGAVPAITELNPAIFDSNDIENTFVKFTINIDDAKVTEAIIVASYNFDTSRIEIQRVSAFPATVTIKLADIAPKFDKTLDDVELGDVITFEVITVVDGRTFRSNAAFDAAVVCAYNPDRVTGNYQAVSEDWAVAGPVTITVDPEDPYVVYVTGLAELDGLTEDKGPLKMVINPTNFEIVADKTVLASVAFDYNNLAYAGTGKLNTCDGTYEMFFTITVDEGSFGGPWAFTLTKQ